MNIKIIYILYLFLFSLAITSRGNNITFANQDFCIQDTNAHTRIVQFDISWENSWRDDENYDCPWVFLKYSVDGGITWHHGTLTTTLAGYGSGTGLDIIVPSDKRGAFLRRTLTGEGTVDTDGIQFVWDYGTDVGADAAGDRLAAFAIVRVMGLEMVYIPQGSFYMGDRYHNGSGNNAYDQTFRDSAKAQQTVANGGLDNTYPVGGFLSAYGTQLYVRDFGIHALNIKMCQSMPVDNWRDDALNKGGGGIIAFFNSGTPADAPGIWFEGDLGIARTNSTYLESDFNTNYPTGFRAFYLARYEVSQAQYRDFLNSLSPAQAVNRFPGYNSGLRFGIQADNGLYGCDLNNNGMFNESNDGECIPASYCSDNDSLAMNDWVALRWPTEFEYEKACRGTNMPVMWERANGVQNTAGGAADVIPSDMSNAGTVDEVPSNNTDSGANLFYNIAGLGPFRSGCLATSTSDRRKSGAGYYGNMELSGNMEENTVTAGTTKGRSYTAQHGDGELDANGERDVIGWPGGTNSGCISVDNLRDGVMTKGEAAVCQRGGEYKWTPSYDGGRYNIGVSSRYLTTSVYTYNSRSGSYNQSGLRGARTAE